MTKYNPDNRYVREKHTQPKPHEKLLETLEELERLRKKAAENSTTSN